MPTPLEAELHYPMGDALPPPGRTLEVAPGLRWVRMGLPFALDHVNLWLLRDASAHRPGWAIVDCGISHDATREAWRQVFAHELGGDPVLRVLVTHMHPDHVGMAHWLCQHWSAAPGPAQALPQATGQASTVTPDEAAPAPAAGSSCELWISATDWFAARMASQSTTGFGGDAAAAHFARHGLTDPAALDKVRARSGYYPSLVPSVPGRFRRLMDGMEIVIGPRRWRCLAGWGHAPEHMALFDEAARVLISGDMVLPRISTNVSVTDLEPEGDPLTLYLDSIEALRALPADTLVLPSHGRPFVGLHRRIDQLQAHHRERLDAVRQACRMRPSSAADLLPVLFRRTLDLHQTTFAMGEAIAHLHHLRSLAELEAVDGPDGVRRFQPVSGR